uniref:Lipase member H n=2 Tax=Lygus hesperus TaxID=30085 RepID=A0A146LFH2_LYGHE
MNYLYEIFCTTATLYFAGNPYTIQIIPKGDCSYCCPMYPEKDITLHLSTKINNIHEHKLFKSWGEDYYIRNNKPIVIYIHGFSEQASGPNPQTIKKAYMHRGDENLILVDWSTLAALRWYDHAVQNTRFVALTVSNFIDDLVHKGVALDRFHVVGFSLGAEIAGLVGKMIKSGKLRRITGLDPAMPLYLGAGPQGRLDANDAHFVDVIHTDGGILGFARPLGHADFYPNGGTPAQPGCTVEGIVEEQRINEYVACSHNKAWKYYAESVMHPADFPSVHCKNFDEFESNSCEDARSEPVYMGYLADPTVRGTFFLQTNEKEPYGRGIEGRIFRDSSLENATSSQRKSISW